MQSDITVTIGEVVIDWISSECGADPGNAVNFGRFVGGNAVNVSMALGRLGRPVRLVGKMGTDFHSLLLKEKLGKEKIDLTYLIEDPGYPTAQCYGFRKSIEETSYFNWPRPNASDMLDCKDITESIFENVSVLHATGISLLVDPRRAAVLKAIELAKSRSVIFSFDAGFPTGHGRAARQSAELALGMADILKVNLEELIFWTESRWSWDSAEQTRENEPKPAMLEDIFEMTRVLTRRHQPLVLFVTLGAAGSCVVTKEFQLFCPPHQISTVERFQSSSIGAGDAFIAAIIDGLVTGNAANKTGLRAIHKNDWLKITSRANLAGALATRSLSAVDALPTRNELDRILSQN